MVAHDSAQFLQPSCVLLPKTETSVPQFAPANVLRHFSNKGRLLNADCRRLVDVLYNPHSSSAETVEGEYTFGNPRSSSAETVED